MNRTTVVVVVAIAMLFAFSAEADKGDPRVLLDGMAADPAAVAGRSTPDSQIVVDISDTASWDGLDSANNVTLVVPLGADSIMTGVGWDVNITTVGASWLSEPTMYFDNQDLAAGVNLTVGVGDDAPGTAAYAGPVLDFTDAGVADITIGADGNLYIQFFEGFDDVADAIDANFDSPSEITIAYIAGQAPTATPDPNALHPVPTMNRYGITAMVVLLLGVAILVISRRK